MEAQGDEKAHVHGHRDHVAEAYRLETLPGGQLLSQCRGRRSEEPKSIQLAADKSVSASRTHRRRGFNRASSQRGEETL